MFDIVDRHAAVFPHVLTCVKTDHMCKKKGVGECL
jgi:hypothetical protein